MRKVSKKYQKATALLKIVLCIYMCTPLFTSSLNQYLKRHGDGQTHDLPNIDFTPFTYILYIISKHKFLKNYGVQNSTFEKKWLTESLYALFYLMHVS